MEIEQIKAHAEDIARRLKEEKGYDSTYFNWITISPISGITASFDLIDDFQKELVSAQKYHCGYCQDAQFDEHYSLLPWFSEVPTRSQREARVLIRQLNSMQGMAAEIKDLEVEQILQSILSNAVSLSNMLEHDKSIVAQAEAEGDSEVPY